MEGGAPAILTETVPLETWREETTYRTVHEAEEGGENKLHLRLNVFIVNTEDERGLLSTARQRHVTADD